MGTPGPNGHFLEKVGSRESRAGEEEEGSGGTGRRRLVSLPDPPSRSPFDLSPRADLGSEDKTARIWDATTGEVVRALEGHEHWVYSVAWSPDGRRVATGSFDNTARI